MSFIGTLRDRLREYELFQRRDAVFPERAPSPGGSPGAGSFSGCLPSLPKPDHETAAGAAPPPAGNLIFGDRNRIAFLPHSYGTPLDSRSDGKIVVFGLPKAGNVWLVSLLCDYTGLPPVHPITDVDRAGVGMCHLPYDGFMAERADFLHAVYLVRDIRDIIVSYYHNGQTQWFKDDLPNFHYETIEEFYFEWFLPRVVPVHQIRTHADAYLSFGVPVIRYERLCEDAERELGRLIKRLGLPYDNECIRQAVANNRIDKLRAEGRMLNRMVPPSHFRKGGHGSYRTELPDSVLQHATREFGELIRKWGYPDARSARALSLREIATTKTLATGADDAEAPKPSGSSARYWSEHHVEAPDNGFAAATESLAHFHWRNRHHLGYLETMPVAGADGKVVVDFGCGPGNDLVGFGHFSRPARLIGIDVSAPALRLARRRVALHKIDADLIRIGEEPSVIPLATGAVDLVHCSGVLMITPNPGDVLREFRRILRPDGYAQVMVYHHDSLWMHLYVAYVKLLVEARYAGLTKQEAFTRSTDGEDCPISTAYRFEEFAELAAAAGLRCEFAGVSISTLEMQLLPQRFAALEDKRLDRESGDFLYDLRFDDRGFPVYRGRIAGINLACRLYPC